MLICSQPIKASSLHHLSIPKSIQPSTSFHTHNQPQFTSLYHNMSQTFLNQLLNNPENRVQSEQGEQCSICLEEYDTLNTSTGTIECQIRLPCNHSIGSLCVVTWLQTGKNCPVCRAVFFGAASLAAITRSDDGPGVPLSESQENQSPALFVADIFHNLDFPPQASPQAHVPTQILRLATSMASRFTEFPDGQAFSTRCVAAVNIYMAARIWGRSLDLRDIARAAGIEVHEVTHLYQIMYPLRDQLTRM